MDYNDAAFATLLEREIKKRLYGDGQKEHGLYRQMVLGPNNAEHFVCTKNVILTYEEVLKMMQELQRRLNTPEEPERVMTSTPRMN